MQLLGVARQNERVSVAVRKERGAERGGHRLDDVQVVDVELRV